MVLNYNSEHVDINRPEEVARMVYRPVVYPRRAAGHHAADHCQPAQPTRCAGQPAGPADAAARRGCLAAPHYNSCRRLGGRARIARRRRASNQSLSLSWMTGALGMEATRNAANDSRPGRGRRGRLLERTRRPRRVPAGAAADTGIVFVRGDLPGCPRIPATVANRVEMPRRTGAPLRRRPGWRWSSTSWRPWPACRSTTARSGSIRPEMPGCDGSSLPFVEALRAAGIVEQDAPRALRGRRPRHAPGQRGELDRGPALRLAARRSSSYELDYGSGNPIGRQSLEVSLSPRYFHLEPGPQPDVHAGARGGGHAGPGAGAAGHLPATCWSSTPTGRSTTSCGSPTSACGTRCVDMVGDLALAGCDLVGRFVAYRSGHRLNAELVRAIVAEAECRASKHWKRCRRERDS